jgi:hypothetical protein
MVPLLKLKTVDVPIAIHPRDNPPKKDCRIIIFSPDYPKGHEMRYRIINAQFFLMCKEATHWSYLEEN